MGWIPAGALYQDEIDWRMEVDAELENEHATSNVAPVEPKAGETRSYHSHILVERDAICAYYAIHVE